MDAIAVNVFQGLTSLALDEFKLLWNAKEDAEKMKNTVRAIRFTLLDAEAKAKDHQVSFWLERLKDVLYDADDLLDDLSTEVLTRELMTRNKVAKKVRIFFSKSNQFVYDLKMGRKMREIREQLDEIDDEKKKLKLNDQPLKPSSDYEDRKQTYSFVAQDEIIGRDMEKNLFLRYLLYPAINGRVSIIPLVGFGGLGKTALAQLVYNHENVQKHFEFKRWVCVSDEFNVRQIAQKILRKENTKDMEQVQQDLRQSIQGKRFLIVLDDVWNEDVELWLKMKSLLMEGAHGSKIIVTTRSAKVAEVMGTDGQTITLRGLSEDRSWRLFCRMAYGNEKESNNVELVATGREIVKKCGGVPLAIRIAGRLVYDKNSEGTDLSYLKNSELWNMDQVEDRIFGVLKLSYDHLCSPMKNCVAFCSLFPKDFLFKKQTLIQMWMAEGFIRSLDQMRCEEDVGHECFMKLLSRSFFQDVTRNKHGDIVTCKMHDLIHDLARFVAKNEYLVVNEGKEQRTRGTTRHLSYEGSRKNWKVPTSSLKSEKLRTVLILKRGYFGCLMDESYFGLVTSRLNCLRVLVLQGSNITQIPISIGKLKHLRFLDLSHNQITQLPRNINRLHNLQTLNLSSNNIHEFPRDISNLVNLRHLQFDNCMLIWMPHGLGQLTSLRTLTEFVVGDKRMQLRRDSVGGVSELGELNNLRGSLQISGLKHLRHNPEEAESAKLKDKQHLQHLTLVWSSDDGKCMDSKTPIVEDELILQRLRPHDTIKSLVIKGFCGERLPDWIGNLKSLQYLEFHDCECLPSLSEVRRNIGSSKRSMINGRHSLGQGEVRGDVRVSIIYSSDNLLILRD
ncbi:putative disease resistance protein RGA4 [Neltuma alba]|uniref:putative disease resistance protein RGA4 n=1 Tax=Neltuma alba TaxID=207710 RepID=UPI0010A3D1CA|nr:putative disease resistance protein RGA4 [Prosopis alba]